MQDKSYYDLDLNFINGFFSDSRTVSFLNAQGIYNIGQLLDIYETNKYENIKNSNFFSEIDGSIKLLKYKFFGEDPNFNYETDLSKFGFSTKAFLSIKFFKLMDEFDNYFNALQVFSSEDVLEIFSYVHCVEPGVIDEIREKCKIINEYHKEILNSRSNNKNVYKNIRR